MKFSILILSHDKINLLYQALCSAQTQSYPAWDILLMDSGKLLAKIPHQWLGLNTVVVPTGETDETHALHVPSWVLNKYIPQLRGDWIVVLCDDDILMHPYLEAFGPHVAGITEPACRYTGQFRVRADEIGAITEVLGHFAADKERGEGEMDCQVDYLQFIFNRAMWDALCLKYDGKPFPEDKESAQHADGIFMERAVAIAKAQPVPGLNCINRRTPLSRFCGA